MRESGHALASQCSLSAEKCLEMGAFEPVGADPKACGSPYRLPRKILNTAAPSCYLVIEWKAAVRSKAPRLRCRRLRARDSFFGWELLGVDLKTCGSFYCPPRKITSTGATARRLGIAWMTVSQVSQRR